MRKKKLLSIVIFAILILFITNYPLFECVDSFDYEYMNRLKEKYPNCDVLLMRHTETTGAGWIVENQNLDSDFDKSIIISTHFDPRFLRDNKDFEMDYNARYLVVIKRKEKIKYESEDVLKVYPRKIIVVYNTGKKIYRFRDMTFVGIIKATLGIFIKKFSLSI